MSSYRITNTTVQPSILNGGNLSVSFNTQAMRTVNGVVTLSRNNPPIYYTVINKADGNPLTLGPSDFIVAYAVSNGGSVLLTPASYTGITGPNYSPSLQFAINQAPPTYSITGQPTPDITGVTIPITPVLTTGKLLPQSGYTGYIVPYGYTGGTGPSDVTSVYPAGYTGYTATTPSINPGYGTFTNIVGNSILLNSCASLSWVQLNQKNNPFSPETFEGNSGIINITLLIMTAFS